jgi:hypothetical protein
MILLKENEKIVFFLYDIKQKYQNLIPIKEETE